MQTASPTQQLASWPPQASLSSQSEKIIWFFLAATSCQLAFLQPYVILVAAERVNLFSGLLCLLTLMVALILAGRGGIRLRSPEFLFSVALVLLGVVSSLHSPTPLSSFYRMAVLLASGLGGFWCARILLNTPENQRRFQWLCLVLLSGVVLLSLRGYQLTTAIEEFFFKSSNHPLVNLIFLLSFAPLALLASKSLPLKLLACLILGLGYVVLCLSQRLSVVFIPMGLVIFGVLFGALRWKHLLAALLVAGIIIGLAFHEILWFKFYPSSQSYRIENYFLSWDIIKQHPLLGIGLRTPRNDYLKNYQVKSPNETKEKFTRDLTNIVTADNQILTLLTGAGLPFTIIYFLAVILLLLKLVRTTLRPPPGLTIPPFALLLPLAMALVHFQVYDGLLYPQNSWFFHILLGLIPMSAAVPRSATDAG